MYPATLLTLIRLRHPYNDLRLNKQTTVDFVVCLFVVVVVVVVVVQCKLYIYVLSKYFVHITMFPDLCIMYMEE